jgi:uncharacterized repeat protein (TIGR01451 family)
MQRTRRTPDSSLVAPHSSRHPRPGLLYLLAMLLVCTALLMGLNAASSAQASAAQPVAVPASAAVRLGAPAQLASSNAANSPPLAAIASRTTGAAQAVASVPQLAFGPSLEGGPTLSANNAALTTTKSVSSEPLLGGAMGFSIAVRNTASGGALEQNKAYNLTITDVLPAEVSFVSGSPAPTRVAHNADGTTTLVWAKCV